MIKELITKKDIRAIKQKAKDGTVTPDESNLLLCAEWSEFQVQSGCYNLFKSCGFGDKAIFLQIDNGGSPITGTKKKKGATGTQSGWPDVEIKMWKKNLTKAPYLKEISIPFQIEIGRIIDKRGMSIDDAKERVLKEFYYYDFHRIYIEFKKIGGKVAENQQKWHKFLKEKGELVYYCNNILFFEKVILKEIKEFLKI